MCITYTNYGYVKDFHLEIKLLNRLKLNKNLISIAHFGIRCIIFIAIKWGDRYWHLGSEHLRGDVADIMGKN